MNDSSLHLNICHLYAQQLNLYGDRGNIISLVRRCGYRGIKTEVVSCGIGEDFDALGYDIVFLGGGQDFEQALIRNDLIGNKGPSIIKAVNEGVVFLCICGGYQMMGEYYIDQGGNRLECLKAIPVRTETGVARLIGNVICSSAELGNDPEENILIGFENHSGRTYLGEGATALGSVILGAGNNGEDGTEGARYNNVFCTYLHGSFLPKNPAMADRIIATALKRKYPDFTALSPLDDVFEKAARDDMKARYKLNDRIS